MSLFSNNVMGLQPYIPGEQTKNGKYIKLNTNENPYPPSEKVVEAIKNADFNRLRLYPDPESSVLRETYAQYLKVKPENVFVGNGSDEVLAIAFQTFFIDKENVIMPDVSYSFYPVYCSLYNVTAREIPLKEDYTIDINDYLTNNNGVVIANPNAPTSIGLPSNDIETILKINLDRVVLIDEAYIDFGGETVVPLINKYNNLLVVRTLSKSYSLAGLRVGFAVGSKELIDGMNTVKNSFNSYPVDMLAGLGAISAIKDVEYLEETRNKIMRTRRSVSKSLIELGFKVLDSQANFLFITHKEAYAQDLYNYLRENKILVRYFKKPRLDNYLRVTIGTEEEMNEFIECISKFLKKEG